MATQVASPLPPIDRWTLGGLSLLLLPLPTITHELGGHALTGVAPGQRPSELGAYYIECPGAVDWVGRVAAATGTSADVPVFAFVPGPTLYLR